MGKTNVNLKLYWFKLLFFGDTLPKLPMFRPVTHNLYLLLFSAVMSYWFAGKSVKITCALFFWRVLTGTGDRHRRWAHLIHHFQNWFLDWCQPVKVSKYSKPNLTSNTWNGDINTNIPQGPWGPPCLLLPGPGPEVSRLQPHRSALQDQAHLSVDVFLLDLANVFVL